MPTHGPLSVHLVGTVAVDGTITFGAEANDVSFEGPATVSGGTVLKNWKPDTFMGRPVWSTEVPKGSDFRELFVGKTESRAPRPRLPKLGLHRLAKFADPNDVKNTLFQGQDTVYLPKGDFSPTAHNPRDVELVVHQYWVSSRMPVESVTEEGLLHCAAKSVMTLADGFSSALAPYYLDNVAEAFDTPGQWYLDRPAGKVYYLPRRGESVRAMRAVAPGNFALVRFQGAKNVSLEGLKFAFSEYQLPRNKAGDVQAAFEVPGAVQVVDSTAVRFNDCRIEHVGGYGLQIDGSSKSCEINNSTLTDLGAGGVKIENGTEATIVADNEISAGGRIYPAGVGVIYRLSGSNSIIHNRIHDFYYTGISGGWAWSFDDTVAKENQIAFNDIFDIGQDLLSDMGGIYVLGKQPNSRIVHNRIHDVSALTYGGWGIYLDEGSMGWMVSDNVVWNTKTGGLHIHYGNANLLRHNVFAYARTEGQLIRARDDKQGTVRFENNLVIARPGDAPIVVGNWLKRAVTMTGMLYAAEPTALPFGDDGTGKFVKASLRPDGTVLTDAAFAPIDMSQVGPRHH